MELSTHRRLRRRGPLAAAAALSAVALAAAGCGSGSGSGTGGTQAIVFAESGLTSGVVK